MSKIDYILLAFVFLNDVLLFNLMAKYDKRFFLLVVRLLQVEKNCHSEEKKKDEHKGDNNA